jgi:hypothetical protein
MLEIFANALILLWVIGLVTDRSFGGAIHVLLFAAGVMFLVRHRSAARSESASMAAQRRALIPTRQFPASRRDLPLKPRRNVPAAGRVAPAPPGRPSLRRGTGSAPASGAPVAKAG